MSERTEAYENFKFGDNPHSMWVRTFNFSKNQCIVPSKGCCQSIADGESMNGFERYVKIVRDLMLAGFCLLFTCGCTISPQGITINVPKWTWPVNPVNPKPIDDKIVGHEFRFLCIEDVDQRGRLSKVQLAMLTGSQVRDFLKANCVKDAGGNPQYRIVDKATELTGVWKELAEKYPAKSYPWLILSNGSAVSAEPLPTRWEELTADLNKYAGVK